MLILIIVKVVVQILALLTGLFFIYLSVFTYENEDGKVISLLDEWWIKIDDLQKVVISRHVAFLKTVSCLALAGFDRLFGSKLISPLSAGVSICYSFSSMAFGAGLFIIWDKLKYPDSIAIISSIYFGLPLWFLGFLFLGSIPWCIVSQRNKVIWLTTVFTVIIITFLTCRDWLFGWNEEGMLKYQEPSTYLDQPSIFFIVITYSYLCNFLFVMLTRKILRWNAVFESIWKMIFLVFANIILSGILIVVPWYLTDGIFSNTIKEWAAMLISASNMMTVACSLAIMVLSVSMLIHRATWPILNRAIYSVSRFNLVKRKKLLGSIGVTLIGIVIPPVREWSKALISEIISLI